MRFRWRFLSSCSSSSVIVPSVVVVTIQSEIVVSDPPKDHAFDPAQIEEAVAFRLCNGVFEGSRGVLPDHAEEVAQGKGRLLPAPLLERSHVGGEVGRELDDAGLLGRWSRLFGVLPWWPMLLDRDPLAYGIDDPGMGDALSAALDLDPVLCLSYFYPAAEPFGRDRVTIGMETDVSLEVDDALMEPVDVGHPDGEWLQARLLKGEELARYRPEVTLVPPVDLVAPRPGLGVQVRPIGEGPSGEKVALDIVEKSLHPGGPIGIADLVGDEGEAVSLAEGLHLGDGDHVRSRPLEDHDVGVVDHDPLGGPAEVLERVGQEGLALETLKPGDALEEDHPRVTQHGGGRLDETLLPPDHDFVRRGVMLALLSGLEGVLPRGDGRLLADSGPAAEGRQSGVRQLHPRCLELLMDPDEISLAGIEEVQDLLPVRLGFLRPVEGRRHLRARADHLPHHLARDLQRPCNRPLAHTLPVERQDRRAHALVQHGAPPRPSVLRDDSDPKAPVPGTASPPLRASRQLSHKLEVLEQDLSGADLHRRLFDLAPCTKKELGTLQDTSAHVPGSISPGL